MSLSKDHVNYALTQYLQALSFINDNQVIVSFKKVPEGLEVKVKDAD